MHLTVIPCFELKTTREAIVRANMYLCPFVLSRPCACMPLILSIFSQGGQRFAC